MKRVFILLIAIICYTSAYSYVDKGAKKSKRNNPTTINLREECEEGNSIAIQNINNVRATLLSSGDVWWDLQEGQYFVPNTPPEIEDVSSIFAGSVWIGGYEPVEGGEDILKIAATTYRTQGGDWYPGPLSDDTGTSCDVICKQWDQHFEVTGDEIDLHRINYNKFFAAGAEYPKDSIPDNVRFYPGLGNTDFAIKYGFQLPTAGQGLGAFYDHPNSQLEIYDPENGDYPVIEVRGCFDFGPQYPDQMFFWIYNDQAGPHTATNGEAIQMEVQVQAFAYESNDELNDMTFQRYKLINRAQTVIKDCYFAMWVDGDLGCSEDDYIGCDTSRSMAILYNQDEVDGDNGSDCSTSGATYGSDVPILGVDYFRGPLKPFLIRDGELAELESVFDEPDTLVELGMSSFVYTIRPGSSDGLPPGTFDCDNGPECYNLLDGKWRDGLAVTFGGSGYNIGSTDTVRYVLPGEPADDNGWSMCSADQPFADRRTIQASGPFILKQGAVNELIIGVVWVPKQVYPCPELGDLNKADDLAQALFDNCFQTLDGPDGPDVDVVELDREIILLLSNDTLLSNNQYEEYSEVDIFATDSIAKQLSDEEISYEFEGYILYQLLTPNSTSDLDNIEEVRIVRQVDVKNNVTTLYNWNSQVNPLPGNNELVYTPEQRVVGGDNGIQHSFSITQDAFNQGDTRLINHKEYYFFAVAYGYNDYLPFDPKTELGQQRPFISGRKSFGVVTVIPRPMVYDALNSFYGDGAKVTRLSGVGNQGKFIMMEDDMYDKILDDGVEESVEYKDGSSPLQIKIVNPLDVKDSKLKLEVFGSFDDKTGNLEEGEDSRWVLTDLDNGAVFQSYRSLDVLNERILREYGISLSISRETDISDDPLDEPNAGGFVGASIDLLEEGQDWLGFIPSTGVNVGPFYSQFVRFASDAEAEVIDPTGDFRATDGVGMIPLKTASVLNPTITPALRNNTGIAGNVRGRLNMADLNNVDIVFTSDKAKWSKCIVVETSHRDFYDFGYMPEGEAEQLEIRDVPSVSKDADGDGNAIPANDGTEGFGWFPGYAVDVETGERLNIFFGENSTYGGQYSDIVGDIGRDMIWNPNNELIVTTPEGQQPSIWDVFAGGQHTIYVTRTEYDECESFVELYEAGASQLKKIRGLQYITWTGIPLTRELLSYGDGLVPLESVVRLRVDNTFGQELDLIDSQFEVREETNPVYEIEISGKQATAVDNTTIDEALQNVSVVPNPYYAASSYEINQNDGRVKITNVPSKATVTIYSLDGRFISQFKRDARRQTVTRSTAGVNFSQAGPDVIWNLKNSAGIPISSGVYLIHVLDEETGAQRTVKFFGINRKFDPSGL